MLVLLYQGEYVLFAMIILGIVLSLSIHEFGHAWVAKTQGDDTAQREGRLTLNPAAHVDLMGLAMVVLVGFGYARPVPTDPAKFSSRYSTLWVAAAGPGMNLVLAFISINALAFLTLTDSLNSGTAQFLSILAQINVLLMLFNLLPIGPLDGHYILPYFLPRRAAQTYWQWNLRYGTFALLALVVLAIMGLPVFNALMQFAGNVLKYLVVL